MLLIRCKTPNEQILLPNPVAIMFFKSLLFKGFAKPHSSAGSAADLRTGGHWFDPQLGQYSFGGLMIVIATGFIPLSPLSVVSTMVNWESSQCFGKNIVQSTS